MRKSSKIMLGALILFVVLPLGYYLYDSSTPGPLDGFAQCLTSKKVTFFGAFWCPHCQAQKAIFGKSVKKLPYVECSNPDQSQNALCTSKGIKSYPTWDFPDGSRLSKEMSLQELSDKTGCLLPATN